MPQLEIPPWPPHDPAITTAVAEAMADGSWGRYEGPHGERLRELLTKRFRHAHVQLCSSGTIAVELALRGLKVDQGEVILAGYDFPGNFRAIEAVGARPVLADLQDTRYTPGVEQLEQARSSETRAAIISHLHGDLAEMSAIKVWAAEHDVLIVEDACQSPGGSVDGAPVGSWGDAAALSFGGSKLLTAGRGGAVLTSDAVVAQRMTIYTERGNQAFPLSEIQAAMLAPQIDSLDSRNAKRLDGFHALQRELCTRQGPELHGDGAGGALFRVAYRIANRETHVASLGRHQVPVGEGFRGFVKRSHRRCRRVGELAQCRRAAEQTVLLHHAALLATQDTLATIADLICAPLNQE